MRYQTKWCVYFPWCLAFVLWFIAFPLAAQESTAVQHGAAIFRAAGGCSCHTDAPNQGTPLAGGRAIKTPFGVIYSTNITPDPKTGIGTWSDADFLKAMQQGISPHGVAYFPVFPYTSFTRMTEQDVRDLKAYLFSLPPVERANTPPALQAPFGWRIGLWGWRWLYFQPGTFTPDPTQSPEWNRGAYLSLALGHCQECHTPRNWMGGLQKQMLYAGTAEGADGQLAPNITSDEATGIGEWSTADIVWYLQTGLKPDGDDTQGLMSELIDNGFKHMEESDLRAIATYLKTIKPIRHKVVAPAKNNQATEKGDRP